MYNYYPTAINPKSYFFKQTNIKDKSKSVYETKTTVIIM